MMTVNLISLPKMESTYVSFSATSLVILTAIAAIESLANWEITTIRPISIEALVFVTIRSESRITEGARPTLTIFHKVYHCPVFF